MDQAISTVVGGVIEMTDTREPTQRRIEKVTSLAKIMSPSYLKHRVRVGLAGHRHDKRQTPPRTFGRTLPATIHRPATPAPDVISLPVAQASKQTQTPALP
jgi:hypothetical protein